MKRKSLSSSSTSAVKKIEQGDGNENAKNLKQGDDLKKAKRADMNESAKKKTRLSLKDENARNTSLVCDEKARNTALVRNENARNTALVLEATDDAYNVPREELPNPHVCPDLKEIDSWTDDDISTYAMWFRHETIFREMKRSEKTIFEGFNLYF